MQTFQVLAFAFFVEINFDNFCGITWIYSSVCFFFVFWLDCWDFACNLLINVNNMCDGRDKQKVIYRKASYRNVLRTKKRFLYIAYVCMFPITKFLYYKISSTKLDFIERDTWKFSLNIRIRAYKPYTYIWQKPLICCVRVGVEGKSWTYYLNK